MRWLNAQLSWSCRVGSDAEPTATYTAGRDGTHGKLNPATPHTKLQRRDVVSGKRAVTVERPGTSQEMQLRAMLKDEGATRLSSCQQTFREKPNKKTHLHTTTEDRNTHRSRRRQSAMVTMDTARRLIRALSIPAQRPTRIARPGTNSANSEFIDIELQHLPESLASTPDPTRPQSPASTAGQGLAADQLADITAFRSRFRSRAIARADPFDSASSAYSRSSSRSTRSGCDEVVREKRPAFRRRESESCWNEYWD